MSLRNPRILCHPYQPAPLKQGDQVLELELTSDLFAPGAESWGRLSSNEKPNLSHDAHAILENFLALAMCAKKLSQLPPDRRQLEDVKLMYFAVLAPQTFTKMRRTKRGPNQMVDKNYSSHLLRLVASSRLTEPLDPAAAPWSINDPWGHTFGNIQKAINTQAERLKLKEEKQPRQPKKKKRRRRRNDDDDEDDDEPPEPVETIHQKWERFKHLGVWERAQLPVFLNPVIRGKVSHQDMPTMYRYIHQASQSQYFHMVDKYKYTSNLPHDGDIASPYNPYNPINVFSPMGNFLRRVDRLLKDPVYAGKRVEIEENKDNHEKVQKRKSRILASLQDEIKFDSWMKTDGDPLLVNFGNDVELRPEGIVELPAPYEGQLCWLLDIDDMTPQTFSDRSFPWACRTAESKGASREQRAYVNNAPRIYNIPGFLLPPGIEQANHFLLPGERVLEEHVLATEEELKAQYDHTVNMKPTAGLGGMTMARWGEENLAHMKRVEEEIKEEEARHYKDWKTDPDMGMAFLDRKRELRRQMQLECIDEFKAKVHSSEITASKARRSIAKWFNDQNSLAEERGEPVLLSFPRDHVHYNLSVLADALVAEMKDLDTLFLMHKGHERVIAKMVGILQLHLPFLAANGSRPTNIHGSFLTQSTEGSTGKTFLDGVVMALMIAGSFMKSDLITPQFLTGSDAPPDDDNYIQTYHKMSFFMDELQNGLLELKDMMGKGNASSGGSSSIAEMLKTVITKGKYAWIGPLLDKTNNAAWRANGEIKVYAEIAFFFLTNKSLINYSHSTLSRFIVDFARSFMDNENGDVTDKMSAESKLSPQDLEKKHRMAGRWHRNQFISSIEGQLIEGSVHANGIDTSCADHVWKWVKQRAPEFHLTSGFSLARNFDLYRSIVQGFVLYELNVKMFDIVGAPFAQRPWTFHDAMWFESHLVATTEHATLAFGVMRSAFENEELMLTTRLLYTWALEVEMQHAMREEKQQNDIAATNSYSTKDKGPEDKFEFKKHLQKDGSSWFSIVITNPSVFRPATCRPPSTRRSEASRPTA